MGAKKFDMSLETREIKLFGRDIPGFCRDIPGAPEKFEKKRFVFNFRSLIVSPGARRQSTEECQILYVKIKGVIFSFLIDEVRSPVPYSPL